MMQFRGKLRSSDRSVRLGTARIPRASNGYSGPKIADLARRYLEDHVAVRCKPKTQRTARSVVNRHIVPTLGKLPIAAVERKHVMALHESLCETPAMANMVVETLTYMYKLAKGWDLVPEDHEDPCQSIPMNPKRKRERFLTDAEFTRLGQVLDEVSGNDSQVRRLKPFIPAHHLTAPRPPTPAFPRSPPQLRRCPAISPSAASDGEGAMGLGRNRP